MFLKIIKNIIKRILGNHYSVRDTGAEKCYYLGSVKVLTLLRKNQPAPRAPNRPKEPVYPPYNFTNAFIMESFLRFNDRNEGVSCSELINNSSSVVVSCSEGYLNNAHGWLNHLFNGDLFSFDDIAYENHEADLYLLLGGVGSTTAIINTLTVATQTRKPVLFLESAFVRSVNTFCDNKCKPIYKYDLGFVLDSRTAYYDSTRPSDLEVMLNDPNLNLSASDIQRAENIISFIKANYISKYNSQPVLSLLALNSPKKKVLVVDQSYGDNSVLKGGCTKTTFDDMLECAITENPDALIIVKTHPDTQTATRKGYYSGIRSHDNILVLTDPINPLALLDQIDVVYVATSQLGFEALLCNKEVHVFGKPFYAGWGLTKDRKHIARRERQRNVNEIFYITYILYSHYVSPYKKGEISIEEALVYLVELRDQWLQEKLLLN
jgi:capsular polysaccharide export protein